MPKFAFTLAICALAALAAGTVSAETYKWVDAQGQVHYSDRPPPSGSAEKVELLPAQTYRAPPARKAAGPASEAKSAAGPVAYSQFEMRSPQSGEAIINSGGIVGVQLSLEPSLQAGHSIWLYLDGKRVDGLPSTGTDFQLQNVYRGQHQILASVVDSSGKSIVSTQPTTFFVQQHSVVNPPKGPSVQPHKR
jgi:hypothetical protein